MNRVIFACDYPMCPKRIANLRNQTADYPLDVRMVSTDYGNTVSSSIPLMLQKHLDEPALETIVLSGFGVGFSWGSNILKLAEAEA